MSKEPISKIYLILEKIEYIEHIVQQRVVRKRLAKLKKASLSAIEKDSSAESEK